MYIEIITSYGIKGENSDGVYLIENNWNDFGYYSTFQAWIITDGKKKELGTINLASVKYDDSLETECSNINEEKLNELGQKEYISLGSLDYYKSLIELGVETREELLKQLQDIALDLSIFEKYKNLGVVRTSFLRSVKTYDIKNRYHRLATGNLETTYEINVTRRDNPSFKLSLNVRTTSVLPSNIHAIIGNNGSGKTQTLQGIASACEGYLQTYGSNEVLVSSTSNDGLFTTEITSQRDDSYRDDRPIEGVIYISYSPFDSQKDATEHSDIKFIGISNEISKSESSKSIHEIMNENLFEILQEEEKDIDGRIINQTIFGSLQKIELWNKTINNLSFDKNISNILSDLILSENKPIKLETVKKLSSGQKILLLSLASLINEAVERTLIIIDEPELFLHPPLVTAYIRELTNILLETNSLCLVATHSPFIIQELPDECVHMLVRDGDMSLIKKPIGQTFGENISTINDNIFGTDMRMSGFYNFLNSLAERSLEKAVQLLNSGKLGLDAEGVIRAILLKKGNNKWQD